MVDIKKQELPDAKKHQIISFIKSGVRILGYGFLWFHNHNLFEIFYLY